MKIAYYQFKQLTKAQLKGTGVRTAPTNRRDCIAAFLPEDWNPLFEHEVKSKGLMYFRIRGEEAIDANFNRKADVSLWSNEGNLSSLFYGLDSTGLYYGNPKIGSECYLFFADSNELNNIELLVIEGEKWHCHQHYESMLEGNYDQILEELRGKAKAYYPYKLDAE